MQAGIFTHTIDWLSFTLPDSSLGEVAAALGGNWRPSGNGFSGYPQSWIRDGVPSGGRLGTGASRKPREVHVSLPAGIVSAWSSQQVRTVLSWIHDRQGKATRIDVALDDRQACVPLAQINEALDDGQGVMRAKTFQRIKGIKNRTGAEEGETLYIGRRKSETMLRIYNKRLAMQSNGQEGWQHYGIRWELELKQDRAQACAVALRGLEEKKWLCFLVGVLRSCIEFKTTTRGQSKSERSRAPLLPWWEQLTEGFERSQLTVEQSKEWGVEDLKRSIRPYMVTIATLTEVPGGREWLDAETEAGRLRYKPRHKRIISQACQKQSDELEPRVTI